MGEVGLTVDVTVRAGQLTVTAALEVAPGETVAIVGPNGAGKTTLVRALAGLERVETGRISLDGVVLDDVATGMHVTAPRRRVGAILSPPALFPHLSVTDNVAFGLRCAGASRRSARREARRWLELVGLTHLADRRPDGLSGGEIQRTALARALAVEPALLLLDEPFSALDAAARPAVRSAVLGRLGHERCARIVVTHDPAEAVALADRIVVLEEGKVMQCGTPDELAAQPASPYVAELVGLNLFTGTSAGAMLTMADGAQLHLAESRAGVTRAVFHPRAVGLHRDRPAGSPRNVWAGRVVTVEPAGERVRVRLAGRPDVVAEVTREAAAELGAHPGAPLWITVKASEITSYDG